MTKLTSNLKLPIIVAIVVVAGIAGLLLSGVVGGGPEGPVKKHAIEPVALVSPSPSGSFLVNLKDPECSCFLKLNVALKLEPMDQKHVGAAGPARTPAATAVRPRRPAPRPWPSTPRSTTRSTGSWAGFSSNELLAPGGQQALQDELLKEFAVIAERDEAEHESTFQDDAHMGVGPPYHVAEVYFPEYLVSR